MVEGPPKSAAGVRTVTLPGVLIEELQEHLGQHVGPGPDALVFTGVNGAIPKRAAGAAPWAGLRW